MLVKRIISTLLIAVTLLSSVSAISISAADAAQATFVAEFDTDKSSTKLDDYYKFYIDSQNKGKFKNQVIDTPEERIDMMDLRYSNGTLNLYVDAISGEVAVKNMVTGEMIFTNPYDATSQKKPAELLSQIEITYESLKSSAEGKGTYNSFQNCVLAGQEAVGDVPSQINVKYIPNGIRVEYSIGAVDARLVVPDIIEKDLYYSLIVDTAEAKGCTATEIRQLKAFLKEEKLYTSTSGKPLSEEYQKMNEEKLKEFPQLQRVKEDGTVENVTLLVTKSATKKELKTLNAIIKKYWPEFNFEFIDNYYLQIGYQKPVPEPTPLFKVALEYTLENNGFTVRLPANGIRFDESAFRITNISILPYLGATSLQKDGYIFYPDGTGTLIEFDTLKDSTHTTPGKYIYDEDFGKSQLDGGHRHYEAIRYPVFGMTETVVNENGENASKGFLAIVEKGDTMSSIVADTYKKNGAEYAVCYTKTNPRPFDTINGDSDNSWNIVSERKYTGDYKIRYIMLSGNNASYVGMAKAYRQYLLDEKILTPLTETAVRDNQNVPLYIESFGSIETTERFLSIPYTTNVAMTSFKNISQMYAELAAAGNDIKNINFILKGFADGGLTKSTIPYDIDWDSSVESDMNFEELLQDAAKNNYGVYPDFDFAFTANDEWFDGLSLSEHAVKTIDGRYTSKREYSATRQMLINYYELAISPAFFSHFYDHLADEYDEVNPNGGISVSTLGMYLYSDFDEDDPYNREDSKDFIVKAFNSFKNERKYSKVITAGGNAYTWSYVNAITDIATDSSFYKVSSATVPFLGIVLHGFIETATTPINMEGDIDYAILRAIENGAALKFLLSYDNTELLKEQYSTSIYYSVRYDIWLSTLVSYYKEVNKALGDVQTQTIEDHKFLGATSVRVPNVDELLEDAEATLDKLLADDVAKVEAAKEALRETIYNLRTKLLAYKDSMGAGVDPAYDTAKKALDDALAAYPALAADKTAKEEALKIADENYKNEKDKDKKKELIQIKNDAQAAFDAAAAAEKTAYDALKSSYEAYLKITDARIALLADVDADDKFFAENFNLLKENGAYTDAIIAELEAILADFNAKKGELKASLSTLEAEVKAYGEKMAAAHTDFAPSTDADTDSDTNTEPGKESAAVDVSDKYAVVDTTVVYERYSGGKELILNFNNFDVKVTFNGKVYFVAAYSYIILE